MSSVDVAAVRAALSPATVSKLARLDIFPVIDSTNAWLMAQPAPETGMHRVAIADHQTAGRGRGDKRWLSAPGSSLCMSIAYTFRKTPGNMSALTLAAGVAVVHALRDIGVGGVKLKWPNDIVVDDGKLGGMLTESHCRSESGVTVVVGIGINLRLPPDILESIDSGCTLSPADLANIPGSNVSSEALSAAMIDHLVDSMSTFEEQGFRAFAEIWRRFDWLRGRTVTVRQPCATVRGTAFGIDSDGALLVQGATTTTRVISGSIEVQDNGGMWS